MSERIINILFAVSSAVVYLLFVFSMGFAISRITL